MDRRVINRTVPVIVAIGVLGAALLAARPATAEDVSPSPSTSASAEATPSPSATDSASPSATASPSASASPSATASSDPSASTGAADGTPQTLELAFLPDLVVGQPAMVTATSSSGLDVTVTATGTCRTTTIKGDTAIVATGAGTCSVTAAQAGNDEFAAADEVSESFVFHQAEVDVVIDLPKGKVVETGESEQLDVTVTGEEGDTPVPTGTVGVALDGDSIAAGADPVDIVSGTLDASGKVSLVLPAAELAKLAPGDHALYVTYSGDAGYRDNRTATVTIDIVLGTGLAEPPPPGSPNAEFIAQYRPIRGFSYEPSSSDWKPGGVAFDSDYYHSSFSQLWGPGTNGAYGRDDLGEMKKLGVNLLHIYNWNPQNTTHSAFLDAAAANGMGVTIPISNYTHCVITADCQSVPGPGSYVKAYALIKGIFDEIYLPGANTTPHAGAAIWGLFNEFDYNGIPAEDALFVIQSILKLEDANNVPQEHRLPFFVSTSTTSYGGKAWGIAPTQQVAAVLKASATSGTSTTWKGADGQSVTLDAIPAGFWQRRIIASTNPFQDVIKYSEIIFDIWPAAFPGTDKWNTLPPMFFGEMGLNVNPTGLPQPSNAAYQAIADKDRESLACVTPAAESAKTPGGYFLGGTMFEYSQEYKDYATNAYAWWGARAYGPAANAKKGSAGGAPYTIDELVDTPIWSATADGFRLGQTMACPGQP